MNYDKPWMRPCVYTDVAPPKESVSGEIPLDSDKDEVTGIPRVRGDRSAVKPLLDHEDDSPLHYRKASGSPNTFGLEDDDEVEPEKMEEEKDSF